ncbi:MAG: glutamyl-tRNA reductase [Gammaproteobacteria bacterium]|nr:glutamyl-tRNA reductase [Gammaproteobacteria bacterium]
MSLVAFGINHQTAPIEFRERVAFTAENIPSALEDLISQPFIHEVAILSTCNRTEIYCDLFAESDAELINWLRNYHQLEETDISSYVYLHPERKAIRHILRVASGLDSMILGEPQILGQLKTAYAAAKSAGATKTILERLFQHAFSVAKRVRTETNIGANPVSVAFAAVALAKQIFADLNQQTVLLIGAGDTIELTAQHLNSHGIKHMIVANRSLEKIAGLVSHYNGTAIAIGDIPEFLPRADIVISSTASQLPLLGKGAVESALKVRKHKPIFMVDLAVPRDIEPEVSELDDVYLYTVDDLEDVIEENRRSRELAAIEGEAIIDIHVEEFIQWMRGNDCAGAIKSYRDKANDLRAELLQRALQMLQNGKSAEAALEWLSHNLTNKILHTPTKKLNQAAKDGRKDLLEAACEILDIQQEKS